MQTQYEQFAYSVLCLHRCIQKIQRNEMAKYGLKGSHAQCLLAMSRYPQGIPAVELCQLSGKDKAAISRTLSELTREGLVTRESPSTRTYRAPMLLTEQGRQAAARVEQAARIAVEQAGAGLSDEHRTIFYNTLNLLASNLLRMSQDGLEV